VAAARGVRVVLLLQGRVEYVMLHYASRALYGSLLDAGIEIHEYHKGFLHAKVAVIDCQWATIGSSNIDPFSLLLQTFSIMGKSINSFELRDAELVVRPALGNVGSAEFSARRRSIEAGRAAMQQALPRLRALMRLPA